MNGYSEAAEERWAWGRLGAYLASQERAEEIDANEQDWAEAEGMSWDEYQEALDPERFVSEADYFAPTEADLARDDLAEHSLTL